MYQEVPIETLRKTCPPDALGCKSSEEAKQLDTIIGQERAVKSLLFGLGIKELGFNIFVAGHPGTGRTTAVKRFLDDVADDLPVPEDWCYVNNFEDPYQPKAIRLPPGQAKAFQSDMKHLIEEARRELQAAFESEEYIAHKEETVKKFEEQKEGTLKEIAKTAREKGFLIQASPMGLITIPLKDGEPLSEEEFRSLSEEERERILAERKNVQDEIEAAIRQARRSESNAQEALQELDKEVGAYALDMLFEELKAKYQDLSEVVKYLSDVEEDILDNLAEWKEESEEQPPLPFRNLTRRQGPQNKYEVNVLVDNSQLDGAPVVMELNPIVHNLLGRIEQQAQFGALVTDFTMVRAGCLHRANGGFLALTVEDLLKNPFAWETLKRALANREIAIEDVTERYGFISTRSLQPEPIPLDIKIILIGRSETYYLLRAYDEDFSELFKVKADFDTRMERTEESIQDYAAFVCSLCEEEGLRHLEASALAKIVEHGSRLAEDQEKLSTHFREIADVIREASYYATQEDARYVTAEHVKRAVEERYYRSNLLQERLNEMIARDFIKIAIEGDKVGQVNGLSVLQLGDIAFGRPNRITASIGLGRKGLVDIEREAKLGGPIHTKGVMILTGFLAERFSQDKPLTLSARLVFEQSYSGVEGDSASSTELYAILSALSDLSITQGIAVTGSVNQKGEVQVIGGVNEKVEGFYEICKLKGLNGSQGVIIPEGNISNLMLKEEVVGAVEEGKFHVWPVRTVDEGIEILTGVEAGERQEDGSYPEGTVNFLVEGRLTDLAERMKAFARRDGRKAPVEGEEI
jgi:lon-related putative ATP-dependent protease